METKNKRKDTVAVEVGIKLSDEIIALKNSVKSNAFQTMEQIVNQNGATAEKLYSEEDFPNSFLFLGWDSSEQGYVLHVHKTRDSFEEGLIENKLFLTTENLVAKMLLNKAKRLAREGHSPRDIYHGVENFMNTHRHEILELEEQSFQNRV